MNSSTRAGFVSVVFSSWLAALLPAPPTIVAEDGPTALGATVPSFAIKDIRFVAKSQRDFGEAPVVVYVFIDTRCPVALKYLPKIEALWREYLDRGVVFAGVNASERDGMVEVAAQALEYGLTFPVHKDFDQSARRALGVQRTPEVAVVDRNGKLRYRGAVDEQFNTAGSRPRAGREYLREAIDALLATKAPAVEETRADGCLITRARSAARPGITYARHVAPILQKNCQSCHRPGRAAPFSLLDYDDAAAVADMIAEVVAEGRMPPRFADRRYGEFVGHERLSRRDVSVIRAWAIAGAPLGDEKDLPPPIDWPKSEWGIDAPDLVLEITEEFGVPATGYVDYHYGKLRKVGETVEYRVPHDTWVNQIEVLPGNRRVVHHANLLLAHPKLAGGREILVTGYVPGGDVTRYGERQGIRLPAGATLRLQLHYTTTGKKERDRTRVGIVFSKEPVDRQVRTLHLINSEFEIPPRVTAHEVRCRGTIDRPIIGKALFVHMHLRGRDMTFVATYPDGRTETLLSVPNYNFDWQMAYRWADDAKRFPAGTRFETISHYDNSRFNPFNPDPTQTVREGRQSYHEMNYGFLFYVDAAEKLDIRVDPKSGRPLAAGD